MFIVRIRAAARVWRQASHGYFEGFDGKSGEELPAREVLHRFVEARVLKGRYRRPGRAARLSELQAAGA